MRGTPGDDMAIDWPTARNTGLLLIVAFSAGCARSGPTRHEIQPDLTLVSQPPRACPDFTRRICTKRVGQPKKCKCRSEDDLEVLLNRH